MEKLNIEALEIWLNDKIEAIDDFAIRAQRHILGGEIERATACDDLARTEAFHLQIALRPLNLLGITSATIEHARDIVAFYR